MGAAMAIKAIVGFANAGFQTAAAQQRYQNDVETLHQNKLAAEESAQLEQANAYDVQRRGTLLGAQTRMKGAQLAGKQTLAYTASGVDASVGTAANTTASSAMMSELDALTEENNAARQAYGHQRVSQNYARQADQLGRAITARATQRDMEQASAWLSFAGSLGGDAGGSMGGTTLGGGGDSGGGDAGGGGG